MDVGHRGKSRRQKYFLFFLLLARIGWSRRRYRSALLERSSHRCGDGEGSDVRTQEMSSIGNAGELPLSGGLLMSTVMRASVMRRVPVSGVRGDRSQVAMAAAWRAQRGDLGRNCRSQRKRRSSRSRRAIVGEDDRLGTWMLGCLAWASRVGPAKPSHSSCYWLLRQCGLSAKTERFRCLGSVPRRRWTCSGVRRQSQMGAKSSWKSLRWPRDCVTLLARTPDVLYLLILFFSFWERED